jgi:hypothetical protein
MKDLRNHSIEISEKGYTTIDNIYTEEEIESILQTIEQVDKTNDTFRKSKDLFAIRQFLKEVPTSIPLVFNDNLKNIIQEFLSSKLHPTSRLFYLLLSHKVKSRKQKWIASLS